MMVHLTILLKHEQDGILSLRCPEVLMATLGTDKNEAIKVMSAIRK